MSDNEENVDLPEEPDALEWDADDPAGDESAYKEDAAEKIPYDHSQFKED